MSDTFTLYCGQCEKSGPDLRRSAGGTALIGGSDEWSPFLVKHGEHYPLTLEHEDRR